MPQTLNFDTVAVEYIDIIKGGKTYHLRDDVSMEVVAPLITVLTGLEDVGNLRDAGGTITIERVTQAASAVQTLGAALTTIVGNIFRHSLSDVSDEEIARVFSFDERMQIAQLFFSRAGKQFVTPPDNSPATTPTVSPSA